MDLISIAVRKAYSYSLGDAVNVGMLKDPVRLQSLIMEDKAYRFPQTIREFPNLVKSVQFHNHTATCKKKGTHCRFNYPKPSSSETIIAQPSDFHNPNEAKFALESAAFIKSSVIEKLETKDYTSLNHLLKDSKISPQEYKSALELSKRGKHIIYKRNPTEIQINSYNEHLLRAWGAILDVQYCLDPYACIAYMVAYITKDEREMSQILQTVSNEVNTLDFKSSMIKCASAFLNAREVSALEAVYRLLSFPLFKSNFSTVYVPADRPEKRMCLLKPILSVKDKADEDEDVYQTSILDRYAARPTKIENLCLAKISIWYT
ncbi:unnamed protein product [Mytilus coruscus]|uniref:Uncharacterized protein n=1 Tax=Mytilus coruscus TaxID=42192 RepID=A0A6J8A1N6_MYTCO|nr:unnamed protein product [Mytilus coruscus]